MRRSRQSPGGVICSPGSSDIHNEQSAEVETMRCSKRILFFAYGSLSYLIFLGTFLYAVCFIGNFGVPRTLDGAAIGASGCQFRD